MNILYALTAIFPGILLESHYFLESPAESQTNIIQVNTLYGVRRASFNSQLCLIGVLVYPLARVKSQFQALGLGWNLPAPSSYIDHNPVECPRRIVSHLIRYAIDDS
eukprot:gb/GECG01009984.1/.p1 GENE.gb/GECG01009984.1/~~gb/GECG01009984.1/.p1  ORF type:complete len:107 (+),score=2.94 gb/GECG01009984.1/:1-321(+)